MPGVKKWLTLGFPAEAPDSKVCLQQQIQEKRSQCPLRHIAGIELLQPREVVFKPFFSHIYPSPLVARPAVGNAEDFCKAQFGSY